MHIYQLVRLYIIHIKTNTKLSHFFFQLNCSFLFNFVLQIPAYLIAQLIGSTLASAALKVIFSDKENHFVGTLPAGSNLQAFVIEFIITFYLMFIISGVATDNRAVTIF